VRVVVLTTSYPRWSGDAAGRFVVGRFVGVGGDKVDLGGESLSVNGQHIPSPRACLTSKVTMQNPASGIDEELSCSQQEIAGMTYEILTYPEHPEASKATVVEGGKAFLLRALNPTECLRYALSQPSVHVAICGAGTQGQMEDNIRAVQNFKKMTPVETMQGFPLWKPPYGRIKVIVPKGEYWLLLRFEDTLPRVIGGIVSGISLLVVVGLFAWDARRKPRHSEILHASPRPRGPAGTQS